MLVPMMNKTIKRGNPMFIMYFNLTSTLTCDYTRINKNIIEIASVNPIILN